MEVVKIRINELDDRITEIQWSHIIIKFMNWTKQKSSKLQEKNSIKSIEEGYLNGTFLTRNDRSKKEGAQYVSSAERKKNLPTKNPMSSKNYHPEMKRKPTYWEENTENWLQVKNSKRMAAKLL